MWRNADVKALNGHCIGGTAPAIARPFAGYFFWLHTKHLDPLKRCFPRDGETLAVLSDWDGRLSAALSKLCSPEELKRDCRAEGPSRQLETAAFGGDPAAARVLVESWFEHPGDGDIAQGVCDLITGDFLSKQPILMFNEASKSARASRTTLDCVGYQGAPKVSAEKLRSLRLRGKAAGLRTAVVKQMTSKRTDWP
jgi:hypothetical protein